VIVRPLRGRRAAILSHRRAVAMNLWRRIIEIPTRGRRMAGLVKLEARISDGMSLRQKSCRANTNWMSVPGTHRRFAAAQQVVGY
jgi:hypothetical protein